MTATSPSDRARFVGRLAGITQLVFAIIIAAVSAIASGNEPGFVPRWAVLLVAFALPGLIGLLGTEGWRPGLLVAAGLASAVGSVIAMSGVTLIFMVPAVLFFYGAARLARDSKRVSGAGRGRALVQVWLAAAVATLVLGAGAAVLFTTDAACWVEYRTSTGVRVDVRPFSNGNIQVPQGATSVSCSTGLVSAHGIGTAGLLAAMAVSLAAITARRRGSGSGESGAGEAAAGGAGV